MLEEIDCPRGEIDCPEGEIDCPEGEIDCPRGLFLGILDAGYRDVQNLAEKMYECSVRLTEEHFDRKDRYAFST